MDKQKFLDWLSELTYWEYPKYNKFTPKTLQGKTRKLKKQLLKIEQSVEFDDEEEQQDIEEDMPFFRDGINYTKYPVIIAVKHEAKPCGDCGKSVANRRIECKIYETEDKHWRRRCAACDLVWDPDLNSYCIPSQQAHVYFRGKKSVRNK
jgi:hypothetical protein